MRPAAPHAAAAALLAALLLLARSSGSASAVGDRSDGRAPSGTQAFYILFANQ
jgi:hypothetical protein|eukprot:COSAG06_NODE_1009_length_11087_cov_48.043866_11_plen_53_part_00